MIARMPLRRAAISAALVLVSTASFSMTAQVADSACVTASPAPTKKKGLGKFLGAAIGAARSGDPVGSLATSAQASAQRLAEESLACAGQQAAAPQAKSEQAQTSQSAKSAQPARAATVAYPSQLPTPPDKAAEIKAYEALAYVRCWDCEGGEQDEGFHGDAFNPSRRQHIDITVMLEAMQPGESRTWSGSEVKGRITKIGEETQSGFRCMRFRLHIDRGDKSAERDKLYCWGRQNQFLTKERWVDVY